MSTQPLTLQSLLELFDLFERSTQPIIDADGQRLYGVPGWVLDSSPALSAGNLADWITCVGYSGSYSAPLGDERVPVELEEDEDPARYRYRCPETFRWKFLPADVAAVYTVQVSKLLHVMADLLEIPQALRQGIGAPLLNDHLWHLGKARIGPAYPDIWLVRGLSVSVEAVFRHFQNQTMPDQGLVLSTGRSLPEVMQPPRNYRFVALREAIVDFATAPRLDIEQLYRTLISPADCKREPDLPVHFNAYANLLTIRGKPKPWHLKGPRQAAAVAYLYQQACKDRWWVGAGEILAVVYADQPGGKSARLQNLFRGNEAWTEYIANPKKGTYGFRLD